MLDTRASQLSWGLAVALVIGVTVRLFATPYYALAFLPGLLLVSLPLLGRYPQAAFYLVLVLVPFNAFSGLEFLSLSQIFGVLALLVFLTRSLLTRDNPFDLRANVWPWLFVFLLISVASAILSDYRETSVTFLRYLLIAYLFTALTLVFVTERGYGETVPRLIVASVAISSALLICGYFFDIPLFITASGPYDIKRGTGATNDPNDFSAMIIFSLPLLTHWLFESRQALGRVLAVALLALNVTAVLLTYSRGGAIVLGITLGLLALQNITRFRARHTGFVIGAAAVSLVLTLALVPGSYWERLGSLSRPADDRSLGMRASALSVGWDAFKQSPIIGSGPGTWRDKNAESLLGLEFSKKEGVMQQAAHNSYLEYLVGQGLAGMVVFAVVIALTIRNFTVAGRRLQVAGHLRLASLTRAYRLSFVSLLLIFFTLTSNYHKYFWLSLGLSQIALRIVARQAERETAS
jgi:O-antigen ligase